MPGAEESRVIDPVVDAFLRDVDVTLLDRNLALTHSQRLDQLQRFVEFLWELRRAGEHARAREHDAPAG